MKKISFIALFAAVIGMTIMSSCKKDTTHAAPTITFSNGSSQELDFVAAGSDSIHVLFSVSVNAEAEINTFAITQKATDTLGGVTPTAYDAATTNGFKGETAKTYYFDKWFHTSDFVSVTKYDYEFTVTDKDDQTYSMTYTVTKKDNAEETHPLDAASSFTWERVGGNAATGLDTYGLKWTSNAKATHAQVKKDNATKLVILTSAQWTSIETKEDLAAAVEAGSDVDVYDNVSTDASATYDDVIATKVGSEYFIIHVTKATVTSDNSGTTVTITGESKK